MPTDPEANLVEQYQKLEDRVFATYQSRLEAHKRLARTAEQANCWLISGTTLLTIASIVQLKYPATLWGHMDVLLVSLSVAALVGSLLVSAQEYGARSRNMFFNYRKLQSLSSRIEFEKGNIELRSLASLKAYRVEYDQYLDESENHTERDFAAAKKSQ